MDNALDRKRILFLQKRLLFPADSGGKIRTLNMLRYLAKWHEVTYLCNILKEEEDFRHQMEELGVSLIAFPWKETSRDSLKFFVDLFLNLFSQYPFNVNKDYDPRLRQELKNQLANHSYDLIICDFVQMARNCVGINSVPKLLFQHNVEAQIFHRQSKSYPGWMKKIYLGLQWRKMSHFEKEAGNDFQRIVAVSANDRRYFQSNYGWNNIDVIDTAVDLDFYQPANNAEVDGRLVFVGSMDWPPNEEGVLLFVRNAWPIIKSEIPTASFQIVGRNPSPTMQSLQREDGVYVTGTVPDTRPFLSEAQVFVVPLVVGGGTRLKIFEAMAMRKAVVSTHLGAEGLRVEGGKHLLLADDMNGFARQIVLLLNNHHKRTQLATDGHELVKAQYGSEQIARQFEAACLRAIGTG